MKRFLLQAAIVLVLALTVRTACRAWASDETKIRRVVHEMVDGFNDERAGRAVSGLAMDFVHTRDAIDRQLVRQGVIRLIFTERDPETKAFALRLEVPDELLTVEVDGDTGHARAAGTLRLMQLRGEQAEPRWEARFEGDLERRDGAWRFVRAGHETVGGRRPR